MTDSEWQSSNKPRSMLCLLRQRHDLLGCPIRKLVLLGLACQRRAGNLGTTCGWPVVEIIERFADGRAGKAEIKAARRRAKWLKNDALTGFLEQALPVWWKGAGMAAANRAADKEGIVDGRQRRRFVQEFMDSKAYDCVYFAEPRVQCDLIRDVFGNPFRQHRFDSIRQTPDTIALARRMYDDCNFSNMAVLGDALEEAGCNDVNVLDHCRRGPMHVKGCWVVDLVLSRDR